MIFGSLINYCSDEFVSREGAIHHPLPKMNLACVYVNILSSCCYRTDDPPASKELLGVLGVDKLFDYMEIFPRQKFTHFKK